VRCVAASSPVQQLGDDGGAQAWSSGGVWFVGVKRTMRRRRRRERGQMRRDETYLDAVAAAAAVGQEKRSATWRRDSTTCSKMEA